MPYPSPISTDYILEEGVDAIVADRAGEYGAAARVFDCGADTQWDGHFVYDVSAINAGGDHVYAIKIEGCAADDFASGVVDITPAFAVAATGQQAVTGISNKIGDTKYRYLQISIAVAGSTPSITLSAWLIHKDSLDSYSPGAITGLLALAANRYGNTTQEFRAWAGGVADGGPDSDGLYPLSDGFGNTYLVPCPAKLAADSSGLTAGAVAALPEHTTAPTPGYTPPTMIGVVGGVLKRFSTNLFQARRTKDLEAYTQGDRSIGNMMLALTHPTSGVEYESTLKEIMRVTTGIIDPFNPAYGAHEGALFTRNVGSTSGSAVIEPTDGVFRADHVGAVVQLSNAGASGVPFVSTIVSVEDESHATMADAAGNTTGGNDMVLAHDDTAAIQAALYDARARSASEYGGIVVFTRWYGAGSLKYHARSAIHGLGRRQCGIIRLHDGVTYTPEFGGTLPAPTLMNYDLDVDLPSITRIGINGARYCQPSGSAQGGLLYWAKDGGSTYPQVDPYPEFSFIDVFGAGWDGVEFRNRNSGTIMDVRTTDCGGVGSIYACYDANVTTPYSLGNAGMGLWIPEQGANNNFLTAKVSFNGIYDLAYLYGERAGCNVVVEGHGNNFTNGRFQESWASNLYLSGNSNVFGDVQLDDTGCVWEAHFQGWYLPLDVRAAVHLLGDNNRFNDVGFGGGVHATNYATHGVFTSGDPTGNTGRIYSKGVSSYYGAGTGDYAPGEIGTDDAGGIDASNTFTFNENTIATYYP